MNSSSKNKDHKMTFPVFKKAIKQIPIAENEFKIEELKLEWTRAKMKLEENKDSNKQAELENKRKSIKKQIL
jgi:hypothetical protein